MQLNQQIALWADRLRDIAAMGMRYTRDVHDRNAYVATQTVAMEMAAAATGQTLDDLEPLRVPIFSRATPFSTVDAAVIDDDGRILLIQRADNHRWAMPGGACEVGETPAQGAARETLEESGVRCEPVSLVGVFDSRLCGVPTSHHLYMFVFLCRLVDQEHVGSASHAMEVDGMGWFAEDALPADLDPGHVTRIPLAYRAWHGERTTYFDRG